MKQYLIIDSHVKSFKTILSYIQFRLRKKLGKNYGLVWNKLYKSLTMQEMTDILYKIYPDGLYYDGVVWSFNDLEFIGYMVENDKRKK